MRILALAALATSSVALAAGSASDLSMYPKAGQDMQRYVIQLPTRVDEENWSVEIRAGQQQRVDCNTRGLGDNLVKRDLQGWGYNYWEVRQTTAMSTLMACPAGTERNAFVSGVTQNIRYNSRMPVVIYAPKGYGVRYRFWNVATPERAAAKG